jgi:gas vesicle protein
MMDLIIGVAIGAIAIALVVMFSLAQSAKETDELENELFAQKVEKIKAKRHDKSEEDVHEEG